MCENSLTFKWNHFVFWFFFKYFSPSIYSLCFFSDERSRTSAVFVGAVGRRSREGRVHESHGGKINYRVWRTGNSIEVNKTWIVLVEKSAKSNLQMSDTIWNFLKIRKLIIMIKCCAVSRCAWKLGKVRFWLCVLDSRTFFRSSWPTLPTFSCWKFRQNIRFCLKNRLQSV